LEISIFDVSESTEETMPGNDTTADTRSQYALYWTNVYKALWSRLLAYALVLTNGNHCYAEDLVQEAFCRVFKYLTNPERIKNPFAYLKTIIQHIWVTNWRRERTAITVSWDELLSKDATQEPAMQPDVERILLNDELRDLMNDWKGPLTADEQELLRLHLEGFSCQEIAEQFGQDVPLIRVKLNALVSKVRSRIIKRMLELSREMSSGRL
jgi:RNA polymerase sigma factor (sigma-70 family)